MNRKNLLWFVLILWCGLIVVCTRAPEGFQSEWPANTTRYWAGPEYWTNRLQDWQIEDGKLMCIRGTLPIRTVHLLTHYLAESAGSLQMSVRVGLLTQRQDLGAEDWAGFLVGAGSLDLDYRARAIIHQATGENGGLVAALNGNGELVVLDNENELKPLNAAENQSEPILLTNETDIQLKLELIPKGETYSLRLSATDIKTNQVLAQTSVENINPSRLSGNLALVANGGADQTGASFWFKDWKTSGTKVAKAPEQAAGPVLGTLFTQSKGLLKLTAQLMPVAETDPQYVRLEVRENGQTAWRQVAEARIIVPGWTAPFRVPDWEGSKDFEYRVVYALPDASGQLHPHYFTGSIPKDPVDKSEIVVAAFTGNNNTHGSFGRNYSFTHNRLWFPHNDIVNHVRSRQPDFLVYTGDQVYEGRPTSPDRSGEFSSYLDYLYKWNMFIWAHGKLTRHIPAVCMPDDHDVYHGNIWGAGGIKAGDVPPDGQYPEHYRGFESHWRQDRGGYVMPPEFVKMVERTQTSHLPDPYDPTPITQGIGVYYTSINYGGISFAVLEDRKFKSSPSVMLPWAKVVNGFSQLPDFDGHKADVPAAKLLGDRQLKFLEKWAADWQGAWMKVALSQTVFANVSTYPEKFQTDAGTPGLSPVPFGVIPEDYRVAKDMDSNGWPQTGRNKALHELRRGFAFTIAGDQHLGSIVQHGIDEWNDAGFSFCVPAIANLWPRRWYPPQRGENYQPGMPDYTGSYLDGFGNHITVWAVSNPVISNQEPADLHDRAPGYGIVRLNKPEQKITMECWPRYVDPTDANGPQYPGWPLKIDLADNYGRKAAAYLPTFQFKNLQNPVIQVIDQANQEIVYTVRAQGDSFRAKVFRPGTYTVKIGEPGTDRIKTLENLQSIGLENQETVVVEF